MNHTLHIQIVSFGLVVATCNETKNADFGVLACVFSRSLSLSGGHPVWTLTCTLNSHEIHSSSDFPRLAICSQTQVCGFVTHFHSVLQTQNMSKHISSIAFSKPFVKLFILRRAEAVQKKNHLIQKQNGDPASKPPWVNVSRSCSESTVLGRQRGSI